MARFVDEIDVLGIQVLATNEDKQLSIKFNLMIISVLGFKKEEYSDEKKMVKKPHGKKKVIFL